MPTSRPVSPPTSDVADVTGASTARHAIASRLAHVIAEHVARIHPERRGRGVRQSARVKDIKRGRPYAVSNLPALLADLLVDPRLATDAIVDLFAALELAVRAERGETHATPELWDAHQQETTAQGLADVAVNEALRTRSPGAFLGAMQALGRHGARIAATRLACLRGYEESTRESALAGYAVAH